MFRFHSEGLFSLVAQLHVRPEYGLSLQLQLRATGSVCFDLADAQKMRLDVRVNSGRRLCANKNTFCLPGRSNVVARAAVSRWTGELVWVLKACCRQAQWRLELVV